MNLRIVISSLIVFGFCLPFHVSAARSYIEPTIAQSSAVPNQVTIHWSKHSNKTVQWYQVSLYRGWENDKFVRTYQHINPQHLAFSIRTLTKGMRYGVRLTTKYVDGSADKTSTLVHFITPPRALTKTDDLIAETKPNIIVFVTDDQRTDTVSFMPTLIALIGTSTNFTNGYVTTPVCCPSRSSILTGQYAHNHGVLSNSAQYGFHAFNDNNTLATWLQDVGYTTGLIGKYLNGYQAKSSVYVPPGWDTFQTFADDEKYYQYSLTEYVNRTLSKNTSYQTLPTDYSTDVLTGQAVNFIETTETDDAKPFFLLFTPNAPHRPYTPADKYSNTLTGLEPYTTAAVNETDVTDKTGFVQYLSALTDDQLADIQTIRQASLESLLSIDDSLATLITTLGTTGELNNTVIIFLSDNGYQWGEHRIPYGKSTPYEEAIKVPFIVYDGRNPIAQDRDELILNIDIAPTILALAGANIPDTVDGQSFLDILNGTTTAWRSDFLIENWNDQSYADPFVGLHEHDWVYIHFDNGAEELYHLTDDPYQLTNLIADSEYSDRISSMRNRTITLMQCSGTEQCFN